MKTASAPPGDLSKMEWQRRNKLLRDTSRWGPQTASHSLPKRGGERPDDLGWAHIGDCGAPAFKVNTQAKEYVALSHVHFGHRVPYGKSDELMEAIAVLPGTIKTPK